MTKVGCVIVSYNSYSEVIKTVDNVINQVDCVLIVDNGSNRATQDEIHNHFDNNSKIILKMFTHNMGIAYALNYAVTFYSKKNYTYLFTLDQDTFVKKNCVAELKQTFIDNKNTGVAVPQIFYLGLNTRQQQRKYENIKYAITSGNLVDLIVFSKVDGYQNKLFIDSVDFDFSLRVLNSHFNIVRNCDAKIFHKLGTPKKRRFFWHEFEFIEHSPKRNYYIFRNTIYLNRKYFFTNSKFILKKDVFTAKLLVDNLLFHEKKREVAKCIMKGIRDGVIGKYGR